MPNWRHGFARHNGYGPPPQFPGASPSPGIVHYLSGHSMHAQRNSRVEKISTMFVSPKPAIERMVPMGNSNDFGFASIVITTRGISRPHLSQSVNLSTLSAVVERKRFRPDPRSIRVSARHYTRNHLLSLRLQVSTIPLDLHTCYSPWPVFRDVTDGTGQRRIHRSGQPLTESRRNELAPSGLARRNASSGQRTGRKHVQDQKTARRRGSYQVIAF